MLEKIQTGIRKRPLLLCIYGESGVGKTTFASCARGALILQTEEGADHINVPKLKISSFGEMMQALKELQENNTEKYQSIIIDSLDHLEILIHEDVCFENSVKNIEKIGYGRGYVLALDRWQQFFKALTFIRDKQQKSIILIAHSQLKKITNDPAATDGWDCFTLKLHAKAAGYVTESVDTLLFSRFVVHTKEDDNKIRAYGKGERIMFTECRPSFIAKNRFGLPFQMPLDWKIFSTELNKFYTKKEGELNGTKN